MTSSSPYKVLKDKPLNVPVRQWVVNHPWIRYFPIGADSVVTFTAPWNFPSIEVESKEKALALIAMMREALYFVIAVWVLVTVVLCLYLITSPAFLLIELMALWAVRYVARKWWLPWKARKILEGARVVDEVLVDRRLNAMSKAPGSEACLLATLAALGSGWLAIDCWWKYQEPGVYVFGIISCLALVCGAYACFRMVGRENRSFLATLLMAVAYMLVLLLCWTGFNVLIYPPESREMGRWGFKRSSPTSEALAFMQTDFSPNRADRLLLLTSYRPSGLRMEWSMYSMNKEEFGKMRKSILNNTQLDVLGYDPALDAEKVEFLKRKNIRERFPVWWEIEEGMEQITLTFAEGMEELFSGQKVKKTFEEGETEILTQNMRPAKRLKYDIIYDKNKSRMYFRVWMASAPPWSYFLRT